MSSKSALRSKGFQRLAVTAVVGLLGLGAFVRADGPAPSPPGGVTIADDDTGDGQKWGRAGGRTITYNVTSFNSFSALSWGVVSGTAPGAAFDGGINGGGEVLTFDNSNSNLGNGVARWAGSAILGGITYSTRFTMTTTANGSPKALSFVAGKENPGVNITGTGLFTVNLLFEAFAGGSWQPFLNVFDSLLQNGSTLPSPGAGPATTSLQVGFYYTTGTTTDDAAAHAALQADVTGLKADTTILKTDTTTLKNGLASVQVTLAALSGQVAALATLTAPDLTGLQTSLTTALQQIGNANTKLDQVQDLLQDSSVLLDVQPFKEYRTDGKRAWLLKTSSHGQLVDSTLTTAFIVKTPPSGPSIVQDATSLMATLPIGTGLLEVTYIGPAATVQVFQFNLQATVNSVVVTGSTLTP